MTRRAGPGLRVSGSTLPHHHGDIGGGLSEVRLGVSPDTDGPSRGERALCWRAGSLWLDWRDQLGVTQVIEEATK